MATTTGTRELDAVRQRRAELREAMGELERALAAPSAGERWSERLGACIDHLTTEFAHHVEVTEGPDGLHQAILAGDLRLANQVAALTGEHGRIAADLAQVAVAARSPADIEDVRERATSVLGKLVRHRQHGADLIYQAYVVDIGGGD